MSKRKTESKPITSERDRLIEADPELAEIFSKNDEYCASIEQLKNEFLLKNLNVAKIVRMEECQDGILIAASSTTREYGLKNPDGSVIALSNLYNPDTGWPDKVGELPIVEISQSTQEERYVILCAEIDYDPKLRARLARRWRGLHGASALPICLSGSGPVGQLSVVVPPCASADSQGELQAPPAISQKSPKNKRHYMNHFDKKMAFKEFLRDKKRKREPKDMIEAFWREHPMLKPSDSEEEQKVYDTLKKYLDAAWWETHS